MYKNTVGSKVNKKKRSSDRKNKDICMESTVISNVLSFYEKHKHLTTSVCYLCFQLVVPITVEVLSGENVEGKLEDEDSSSCNEEQTCIDKLFADAKTTTTTTTTTTTKSY